MPRSLLPSAPHLRSHPGLNLFICGYQQHPCVDVQQGVDNCDFTISAPSRGVVSASPSSAEYGSRSDTGSSYVWLFSRVSTTTISPSRDYNVERGGIEGDGVGRIEDERRRWRPCRCIGEKQPPSLSAPWVII